MFVIKPCFVLLVLSQLGLGRECFLIKGEGVAPQGSFLAHVGLSEVLDAGLGLLHLLWCHALEGFHAVFVHVDGEFVHEVPGLNVRSIFFQHMTIRLLIFKPIQSLKCIMLLQICELTFVLGLKLFRRQKT